MKRKYQVGGIIYQLLQSQPVIKDVIDLSTVSSSAHTPIVLDDEISLPGYAPQFKFKQHDPESETTEDPEVISEIPIVSITANPSESPAIVTTPEISTTPIATTAPTGHTTTTLRGKADFKKLEKLYENALQRRGIDKRYAKWLAAQDALESGWGKSQGARVHNYGNLTTGKSWKGNHIIGDDHDGKGNPIKQKFRSYNSVEEYVEDKINFLHYKRYAGAFTGNPDDFIEKIWRAGYATAPKYVTAVKNVYNSWDK